MKLKCASFNALVGLAVISYCVPSNATNDISCQGTVALLGLHSPNAVYLKLSSMNTLVEICNLKGPLGVTHPVQPEQCNAIYSTLLAAYSMQKNVTVLFDNVQTGTNCTNFQAWEMATTRWVTVTQ